MTILSRDGAASLLSVGCHCYKISRTYFTNFEKNNTKWYKPVHCQQKCINIKNTAWKVFVFGVSLVRFTLKISVFSPNAGKYGTEKLWIQTPFTQWNTRFMCCMFCWISPTLTIKTRNRRQLTSFWCLYR